MVSLAFAIAASANFPVLFMSVLWSKCTTRGATVGGFLGLATAVILTVLSKSVWVDVFHNTAEIFPYTSPALFSMAVGFIGVWLFSVTDSSPRAAIDKAGYEAQEVRSETGIGAAGASAH
jgi:cation/acetate symporter